MSKTPAAEKQSGEKRRVGDGTPGPGRKKGIPNKITSDLRAMILGALDDAGGQKYLAQQATANPAAFLTLVGKVLPKEITGANGTPLVPPPQFIVQPVKVRE